MFDDPPVAPKPNNPPRCWVSQSLNPTYSSVTVCDDATGLITILYNAKPLKFTVFHKQEHQAEIVDTQQVDQALQNQRLSPHSRP